ncbi:Fc.00g000120.m01.CDS01 [Cosmosporella sp. VM-42]
MSTFEGAAADPSTTTLAPVAADRKVSVPRPRRHPCLLCQQRKVKCDRNTPCSNCLKARAECLAPNRDLPPKRKKRFPEAELLARLRRYEAYFKDNGLDPEALGRSATDCRSERSSAEAITGLVQPSFSTSRLSTSLKNGNLLSDQFRETEDILQGSSDGDLFEAPITQSFDMREAAADGYDLVFGEQGNMDVADLHPSPLHIFRLWQLFLDNVNPLVKILHAPTVQQQILDASADLGRVSGSTEALMFGVYSMSIASITTEECNAFFGKEKDLLLAQYQAGARKALTNAGLLKSSDLVILQAFALYLLSNFQGTTNPRSLFLLTGMAMRIAQRMGLDSDGTSLGLPPFEAEGRRRLWWQLLFMDNRVAEISGSPNSLTSYSWNTNPPSTANDNELFVGMRDIPVESERLTEMLFVSLQCEIFEFTRKLQATLGSPACTKEKAIDTFEAHLESKYLRHCDPSAPMHVISLLMARLEVWKLRSGVFSPRMLPDFRRQMPQNEQDFVFSASLKVLEFHNEMLATASIQKFVWYTLTNRPFPAYLHLLCGLRTRTRGDLADRAWNQFAEHAENREKHDSWDHFRKSSPLRLAIANMIIKAWEARERARLHFQPVLPVPYFISNLHDRLHFIKSRVPEEGSGTSPLRAEYSFSHGGILSFDSGIDTSSLPDFPPNGNSLTEWLAYTNFIQEDIICSVNEG